MEILNSLKKGVSLSCLAKRDAMIDIEIVVVSFMIIDINLIWDLIENHQ
jgi:hypothetical protein